MIRSTLMFHNHIFFPPLLSLPLQNALSLSPGIEHVSVLITKNDPNSEVNLREPNLL